MLQARDKECRTELITGEYLRENSVPCEKCDLTERAALRTKVQIHEPLHLTRVQCMPRHNAAVKGRTTSIQ